jgi:hypothetical protein
VSNIANEELLTTASTPASPDDRMFFTKSKIQRLQTIEKKIDLTLVGGQVQLQKDNELRPS